MFKSKIKVIPLNIKTALIPLDQRNERFVSIRLNFIDRVRILTKRYLILSINLDELKIK